MFRRVDDAVQDVDVGEILGRGSVFSGIHERRETFEQVRVNPGSHTIELSVV
jgi:hypothetical protein